LLQSIVTKQGGTVSYVPFQSVYVHCVSHDLAISLVVFALIVITFRYLFNNFNFHKSIFLMGTILRLNWSSTLYPLLDGEVMAAINICHYRHYSAVNITV